MALIISDCAGKAASTPGGDGDSGARASQAGGLLALVAAATAIVLS